MATDNRPNPRVTGPLGNPDISDWQYLRRLLPYLLRQKGSIWVAAVLYPLTALSGVLPPFLLQQMFDHGIVRGHVRMLYGLALLYLCSLTFEFVAGYVAEYVVGKLGQSAMAQVRADLFAHVQKLPIQFFSHMPVGRLLTRMTSDVEALSELFATGAISVISDLLAVVFIVGSMLFLSVKLTFASLVIAPILALFAGMFQRFARRAFQAIRQHLARINGYLAEHIGAMSMVQAFGQQKRSQEEFWQLNLAYRDANQRAITLDATLYAFVEAIGTMAVAATLALGARDLASGAVTAGVLVAFMQYIRRLFVPIRDLSTKYTILQSSFAAAERIFSLFDEPVVIEDAANPKDKVGFETALSFRDVSFRFPSAPGANDAAAAQGAASRWVLEDINLTVHKGERIGLVGATGSGKTTMLGLLTRAYDVQRGSVLVDGEDVRALKLASLRRLFAVVLQDASLFQGSIRDNLMIADRISEAQMQEALRVVGADAFVATLTDKLETSVGPGGEALSAGERQVLALARAISLNAPILLMDEATSHVDTPTEARIQAAIDALLQNRTAIIVAHRLSTVRKVDRVVVLDKGRIVQEGPPATLSEQPGPFRALIEQNG